MMDSDQKVNVAVNRHKYEKWCRIVADILKAEI